VRVTSLALDATAEDAPDMILAALGPGGAGPLYVVISMGAWASGPMLDVTAPQLRSVIETNVVGPHALMRRLIPSIAPGGGILVVGSLAGCLSLPWLSVYGASKAHVQSSVLSLRAEVAGSGIAVCLLAPGAVSTGFVPRAADSGWRWIVDLVASTPQTVAHAAYCGLRSNVAIIVPGVVWRMMWLGLRVLPRSLTSWMSRLALQSLARVPPTL
jgi:uncharacterized protein